MQDCDFLFFTVSVESLLIICVKSWWLNQRETHVGVVFVDKVLQKHQLRPAVVSSWVISICAPSVSDECQPGARPLTAYNGGDSDEPSAAHHSRRAAERWQDESASVWDQCDSFNETSGSLRSQVLMESCSGDRWQVGQVLFFFQMSIC